jgi:hypothetical protein
MTGRKDSYLAQLQRRREEAIRTTEEAASTKAPTEMTEDELEAEIKRLDRELRDSREEVVRVGREELAARSSATLGDVLRDKSRSRRKRPWK